MDGKNSVGNTSLSSQHIVWSNNTNLLLLSAAQIKFTPPVEIQ